MTDYGVKSPAGSLQPMNFQPVTYDGKLAVYQARAQDEGAPGAVLALTITTASPGRGTDTEKEFLAFLNTMTAGFALLDEPLPEPSGTGDPEPFDPGSQLLMKPELITVSRPGITGVALTVQTATGLDPVPPGVIHHDLGDTVPAGRDHHWVTDGGYNQAKVTVQSGRGQVRWPVGNSRDVSLSYGATITTYQFTVHGFTRVAYIVNGSFRRK